MMDDVEMKMNEDFDDEILWNEIRWEKWQNKWSIGEMLKKRLKDDIDEKKMSDKQKKWFQIEMGNLLKNYPDTAMALAVWY